MAAVTDYHRFSGLRQHNWIHSQVWRSEVWVGLAKLFSQGITRPESNRWLDGALICTLQEESASKLFQVIGRIQFFVAVGLRSLFSCCLPARGHPQFLLKWCSISKAARAYGAFSHSNLSDFRICPLKDSCDWIRPTQITSLFWGQLTWNFNYIWRIPSQKSLD